MRALAWGGGLEALFAWRAAGPGAVASLVAAGDVASFVLEAQTALLGAQLVTHNAADRPAPVAWPQLAARALSEEYRVVIVACGPPFSRTLLGRVLDADVLQDIVSAALAEDVAWPRTLVVGGPGFKRGLDIVAGDIMDDGDGWRIDIGLRGC